METYAPRMEVARAKTEALETVTRPVHDIPSLDGLRAVSIALVVLSHTKAVLPAWVADAGFFRYVVGGGLHGVEIFFVLSGYLITTLLVREYERTGAVSLRRFYARRALRIFPAFYAYFGLLALLCAVGVVSVDWPTYLASATYTFVYMPHPQGWYVEHAWSLSVEEQFYLLWPVLLVFAQRRRISVRMVWGVLAAMPVVRVALTLAMAHPDRAIVTTGSVDMLMMGCLLALVKDSEVWLRLRQRYVHGWSVAALLAVGLVLVPYASAKIVGGVGEGCGCAWDYGNGGGDWIDGGACGGGATVGRRAVPQSSRDGASGVISYSIYLWQELFTADPRRFGGRRCIC